MSMVKDEVVEFSPAPNRVLKGISPPIRRSRRRGLAELRAPPTSIADLPCSLDETKGHELDEMPPLWPLSESMVVI
jgi:hypothetical protein